jgi:hypothetical protein
MELRLYEEGYQLKENEYLLKIRLNTGYRGQHQSVSTGFITKFNQDGSMPISFKEWDANRWSPEKPEVPIYIHEENYRSGWKLHSWRFGKSQNWASVIHPNGFTLEIYLQQFLEIIENNTIINGEIMGNFKWENRKLIKEK